jgi:hypothetical protein
MKKKKSFNISGEFNSHEHRGYSGPKKRCQDRYLEVGRLMYGSVDSNIRPLSWNWGSFFLFKPCKPAVPVPTSTPVTTLDRLDNRFLIRLVSRNSCGQHTKGSMGNDVC